MTREELDAIEKRCQAAAKADTDPRFSTALDEFHQRAIEDIKALVAFCREVLDAK